MYTLRGLTWLNFLKSDWFWVDVISYCSVYEIHSVAPAQADECVDDSSVEPLSMVILSAFFLCFTCPSGWKPRLELPGGRAYTLRLGSYCQIIPQRDSTNCQCLPPAAVPLGLYPCRLWLVPLGFSQPSDDVVTSLCRSHLFFFLVTKGTTLDFCEALGQNTKSSESCKRVDYSKEYIIFQF